MRLRRVKFNGTGYCRVTSRVVDRQFKLVKKEPKIFVKIMRKVEAFSGVRVVDYVIMSDTKNGIEYGSVHTNGRSVQFFAKSADLSADSLSAENRHDQQFRGEK